MRTPRGPDQPPPADIKEEYLIVRVKLSKAQMLTLSKRATLAELPEEEMIRKAMRAFALI